MSDYEMEARVLLDQQKNHGSEVMLVERVAKAIAAAEERGRRRGDVKSLRTLQNVRALAARARSRKVPTMNADEIDHLLRFCAEVGVVGSVLRSDLAPRDSARCPDGDPYCSCQKPMDAPRDSGPVCDCEAENWSGMHLATCVANPRGDRK